MKNANMEAVRIGLNVATQLDMLRIILEQSRDNLKPNVTTKSKIAVTRTKLHNAEKILVRLRRNISKIVEIE